MSANNTSNPSFELRGDLVIDNQLTGTIIWTKGTGTITLSGAADQTIDFRDKVIEDLVVSKSAGTATMVAGCTTDSFTLNATGGKFNDGGYNFYVAGNITVGNTAGILLSTGHWYLTVSATINNPAYLSQLTTNAFKYFHINTGVTATLGNHFYAWQWT